MMLASTYSNYNDASFKPRNPENIRVQTPQEKNHREITQEDCLSEWMTFWHMVTQRLDAWAYEDSSKSPTIWTLCCSASLLS